MSVKKNEVQIDQVIESTDTVIESKKVIPYTYQELETELKTKSAMVRKLHSEGYDRSQIAKFMNIRYQHVRNILVTPLKKS